MLQATADGATDPAPVAALAHQRMRATPEALTDALGACTTPHPVYRRLLPLTLIELRGIDTQMTALNEELAGLLRAQQPAVERLAAVPGLGVDSAQQIIAEVGPAAETFPSAKHMASWVGACPGAEESAGVSYSRRPPKGNVPCGACSRTAANAAVKTKGSIFEYLYRRWVVRLGHRQAIGAIAHRLCRLIWKLLHQAVTRTRNAARR
jgi:transposase